MKKYTLIFVLLLTGIQWVSGQENKISLKYSKFFGSFYSPGDLRYSVDPGFSYIAGDLGKNQAASSIGVGATYRVLPPIEISTGLRYFRMSATDHNEIRQLSFCGNYFHYNILGRYYYVYDRVRINRDRTRGPKKIKAYLTTGLTLMHYNATPSRYGFFNSTRGYASSGTSINIPLGFGFPVMISKNVSIVPEFLYYVTGTDLIDGIISFYQNRDQYAITSIRVEFRPIHIPKKHKFRIDNARTNPDSGTLHQNENKSDEL